MPVLALACGSGGKDLPSGTLFVGRAPALRLFLQEVEAFNGTPAAEAARRAGQRIAGCEEFQASCDDTEPCGLAELAERLTCVGQGPQDTAGPQKDLLFDADWLFSRGLGHGRWFQARGYRQDGGVQIQGWLSTVDERGPLSLVLPSEEPPGPSLLSHDPALVHLRLRPHGGLDVGSLVTPEGLGAQLFQLRSDLFLATTLAGTWELVVYTPREGQLIPPVALALDYTHRERAVLAMESFIDDVRGRWPVRRSPFQLQSPAGVPWEGACLTNLNVLPDLSPCYVATEAALVVGWNPLSLKMALAEATGEPAKDGDNHLVLYLHRFPEADQKLAAASGAEASSAPEVYPWSEVRLTGNLSEDAYHFQLDLESEEVP